VRHDCVEIEVADVRRAAGEREPGEAPPAVTDIPPPPPLPGDRLRHLRSAVLTAYFLGVWGQVATQWADAAFGFGGGVAAACAAALLVVGVRVRAAKRLGIVG
jgi:hypothetical protein